MKKTLIYGLLLMLVVSCSNYTPKPYGYFRIELPKPEYVKFDSTYPPVNMEISEFSKVVPQKAKNNIEEYIDIVYPSLNGRIYCSYVEIKGNFHQLSEDSRTLVYKHTVRADAIVERPFENPEAKVYGILYEITGNAASPVQFVITDSVNHFMRGALYFNNIPNADSIAPVSAYIQNDLKHLVETIRWK